MIKEFYTFYKQIIIDLLDIYLKIPHIAYIEVKKED